MNNNKEFMNQCRHEMRAVIKLEYSNLKIDQIDLMNDKDLYYATKDCIDTDHPDSVIMFNTIQKIFNISGNQTRH